MDWYMGGFGKFLRGYLLPHMGWLYLGCLGSDKLPIGVAKLPPEGECCMGRSKRYTKQWTCDMPSQVNPFNVVQF